MARQRIRFLLTFLAGVIAAATGTSSPEVACDAEIVVLGAGSLGSTEILERSARAGLDVSSTLGTSVSGNGDFLGYAYDGEDEVRGVGRGCRGRGVR